MTRVAVLGDASSVNVQRWCEGLVSTGIEVVLLSLASWESDSIEVRPLRPAMRGHKLAYFVAVPDARRAVRAIDPDIVVGYYASGYATTARLAGRRPLVVITAGRDVEGVAGGSVLGRLVSRNLRVASLVIAWGPHMAAEARRLGALPDRILVQPRGIPLSGYQSRRAEVPVRATRIISTRSLEPVYRHEEILEAIARVTDIDLTLTIVGDGSKRTELEALAITLGIADRVRFAGRVGNDDLPAVLGQHDIYVSARPHDGVSASLLEAMAAGLMPIVAPHDANRGWVRQGRNGLLAVPRADALAEALRRAAHDADLRRRAAHEGPAIVADKGDLARNMLVFRDAFRDLAT